MNKFTSVVSLCISLMALLQPSSTVAKEPAPKFVKVSPRGTWLKFDNTLPKNQGGPDRARGPAFVSLSKLGLASGDFVAVRTVGAADYGGGRGDSTTALLAAFRSRGQVISPGRVNPPAEFHTIPTCPRNKRTDLAGDFLVPITWLIIQIPAKADSIAFGAADCYWKDNRDPNGDYGVQIATLKDVLKDAVTWRDLNGALVASFKPRWGLTTKQVALLGGYDHLNWVQVINNIVIAGTPLTADYCNENPGECDGLKNRSGKLPLPSSAKKAFFILDPIYGGYKYQTQDFGRRFPVRDDLPWYLDERFGNRGESSGKTQLELLTTDSEIQFFDKPVYVAFSTIIFSVGLVGVNRNASTGDILLANSTYGHWIGPAQIGKKILFNPARTIRPRTKKLLLRAGIGVKSLF